MKVLIGCGKMGGAILDGWLQDGVKDIIVLARNKERASEIGSRYKIKTILSIEELQEKPQVIFCAVKPYQIAKVLPACKKFKNLTFVSVVVGKSIRCIKDLIGEGHYIIRAMPNILCLIKCGVIGVYVEQNQEDRSSIVEGLLSLVGKVFWLKNENEIDITAALAGGLPAFLIKILAVYIKEIVQITKVDSLVVEERIMKLFCKQEKLLMIDHALNCWISDAILLGLSNNTALEMSLRSVVGTSQLVRKISPAEIIKAVASKNGTTEAGLLSIEHGLSPVTGAYRRALAINNNIDNTDVLNESLEKQPYANIF